jgi:methionyl-tRNA formyltransferase
VILTNTGKKSGAARVRATEERVNRILIVGDKYGIPQLLQHIPIRFICGCIAASIRPQYHDEIGAIANKTGLPLLIQPKRHETCYKSFVAAVTALEPDLIWTHSYSMILGGELLSIPKYGGVNIHSAPLPKYRGCNPTEWAIIKGEKETGVTLHELTPGTDEGPIIDQRIVPLFQEDTWKKAAKRLWKATDVLIAQNVTRLMSGRWQSVPQNENLSSYFPRRTEIHGRFSWAENIKTIYNFIRALVAPHPGASYEKCDGSVVTIDSYKSFQQITSLKQQMDKSFRLIGDSLHLSASFPKTTQQPTIKHMKPNSKGIAMLDSLIRNKADTGGLLSKQSAKNSIMFIVRTKKSNTTIGKCWLYNIDLHKNTVEYDISINKSSKKTLNEIKAILLKTALDQLECNIEIKS